MQQQTLPRAMVVDDEVMILMEACDILQGFGFDCLDALHAQEAITALERHADEVTLLFSDAQMPGPIDGFALARHVDQHWPWIEIVLASGVVLPGEGELPDRATFLTKPFNRHTVREHLDTMLPDGKKPEPLRREARNAEVLRASVPNGSAS